MEEATFASLGSSQPAIYPSIHPCGRVWKWSIQYTPKIAFLVGKWRRIIRFWGTQCSDKPMYCIYASKNIGHYNAMMQYNIIQWQQLNVMSVCMYASCNMMYTLTDVHRTFVIVCLILQQWLHWNLCLAGYYGGKGGGGIPMPMFESISTGTSMKFLRMFPNMIHMKNIEKHRFQ